MKYSLIILASLVILISCNKKEMLNNGKASCGESEAFFNFEMDDSSYVSSYGMPMFSNWAGRGYTGHIGFDTTSRVHSETIFHASTDLGELKLFIKLTDIVDTTNVDPITHYYLSQTHFQQLLTPGVRPVNNNFFHGPDGIVSISAKLPGDSSLYETPISPSNYFEIIDHCTFTRPNGKPAEMVTMVMDLTMYSYFGDTLKLSNIEAKGQFFNEW
jgi:hypothetical protein